MDESEIDCFFREGYTETRVSKEDKPTVPKKKEKKLRILLVGPWLYPHSIAEYHRGLARELVNLGHKVFVWCPWDFPGQQIVDPVNGCYERYEVSKTFLHSFDVAHLQSECINQEPGFSELGSFLKESKIPAVQTLHSNCNHYLPRVNFFLVHNNPEEFKEAWCIDRKPIKVPMWAPEIDYVPPKTKDHYLLQWKNNGRVDEGRLKSLLFKASQKSSKPFVLNLLGPEIWFEDGKMQKILQESDIFAPLYWNVDACVTSATVFWMGMVGRPMVLSDVQWFKSYNSPAAIKVPFDDEEKIIEALLEVDKHWDKYVEASRNYADYLKKHNTWKVMAPEMVELYKRAMNGEKQ